MFPKNVIQLNIVLSHLYFDPLGISLKYFLLFIYILSYDITDNGILSRKDRISNKSNQDQISF